MVTICNTYTVCVDYSCDIVYITMTHVSPNVGKCPGSVCNHNTGHIGIMDCITKGPVDLLEPSTRQVLSVFLTLKLSLLFNVSTKR